MKKFFALVLVLACLMSLALSPAYSAVRNQNNTYFIEDAMGSAQIVNGNKAAARDEARRAAYRDAIDRALGSLVPGIYSRTSYGSVEGRVYSRASGLVKNFKVTNETIDGDILTITGSCNVSERSFDGILGPEVISMLGNPRVMIVLDQPEPEDGKKKAPAISPVETELMSLFEKAGYLLVDMDQARTLLALDRSNAYNDTNKLIAAAKTLRADIIVVAKTASSSSSTTVHGVKMYRSSGSVQLKAVQTQTAYQIGSASSSSSTGWGGSASGGAIVRNGIRKAAEEIIYKIAYRMASAGSSLGGITVNVKIANATFRNVETIEEQLRNWLGSTGEVFERIYDNGNLELDVVSDKTSNHIARFLSDYAEVTGRTAQTITAQINSSASQPVTVSSGISTINITVQIDNVRSTKDAESITEDLRKFIGSSGEVSDNYKDPTANLTVTYARDATEKKGAQEISSFLKGKRITVESITDNSVRGWRATWFSW